MSVRGAELLTAVVVAACLLVAVAAPAEPAAGAGTAVSINPVTQNVSAGQSFSVDVVISTDIVSRGAQLGLSFDPSRVRVDSVDEGGFYRSWAVANGGSSVVVPQPVINNSTGQVSDMGIALLGAQGGPSGSGVFATYRLTALAAGVSTLSLLNVTVSDSSGKPIPGLVVNNGSVSVGVDATATVVTATPTAVASTPTVAATSSPTAMAVASPTATATPTATPALPTATPTATLASASATPTATEAPPSATPAATAILPSATPAATLAPPSATPAATATASPTPTATAMATPTPTATVVTLSLQPPGGLEGWKLTPGWNSAAGTINVKCGTNWELVVADGDPATAGHMGEWNAALGGWVEGGSRLSDPMLVRSGSTTVSLEGPSVVARGTPAGQRGAEGEDVPLVFQQNVRLRDKVLKDGNAYRIVISYTGYAAW